MTSTICFSSLKGGVGKSSITIQVANCLGKLGKKVCVIDMDLNNSVSSYYLTNETIDDCKTKNIFEALAKPTNNLTDYVIKTDRLGVDFIPSSLYLVDLRGLSEKRLSQLLPSLNYYDFVIIDTQPTYDNLVLNAYYASDFIITPLNLSLFDLNTAKFLRDKMLTEVSKADKWFLHVNGYNHIYENAQRGNQKDYIDLFQMEFSNITPQETWFPWTSDMRKLIDRNMYISNIKGKKNTIVNVQLHSSIYKLVECFFTADENDKVKDIITIGAF